MSPAASPEQASAPKIPIPEVRGGSVRGLLQFMTDSLKFVQTCAQNYGDFVRVDVPKGPSFALLSDAELVEEMLRRRHKFYHKDILTSQLTDALGKGLLTSNGSHWRRQRRLAQPAFHRGELESYAGLMSGVTVEHLAGWPSHSELDVFSEMSSLTLNIVARTLFGMSVGGAEDTIHEALQAVMDRYMGILGLGIVPPLTVPTPRNRRFVEKLSAMDGFLEGFLRTKRKEVAERQPNVPGGARRPRELMTALLEAKDDAGNAMTDEQLRDECITLFAAGHETTALSLSYSLYLLAYHPHCQRELVRELGDFSPHEPLALKQVLPLPYLDAVVSESMRVYPPAWSFGRQAIADTELGPYEIPKGQQVMIAQWALHRHPRYFAQPEEFRPERWLGPRNWPAGAYLPFGGGPRICIGNHFALNETKLALAELVRRYHFSPTKKTRLELMPSVTLRPKAGVYLAVKARV